MGVHGDDPQARVPVRPAVSLDRQPLYFEAKLTNSHPAFSRSSDHFGATVALDHGWLAVGAPSREAGPVTCRVPAEHRQ